MRKYGMNFNTCFKFFDQSIWKNILAKTGGEKLFQIRFQNKFGCDFKKASA